MVKYLIGKFYYYVCYKPSIKIIYSAVIIYLKTSTHNVLTYLFIYYRTPQTDFQVPII